MFRNYFLLAWRRLLRNKTWTVINLAGLVLGITGAIVIFALVQYHQGFDRFHPGSDRVYRVLSETSGSNEGRNAGVPPPLGLSVREDFALAEKSARIATFSNLSVALPGTKDQRKFQEEKGVSFAEPAYFEVFDFPFKEGSGAGVLDEPFTAVITENVAKKYFGEGAAIGQMLRIVNRFTNTRLDFRVAGVLRNLPAQTDLQQEIFLSYQNLPEFHPAFRDDNWYLHSYIQQLFIKLKPSATQSAADAMFAKISQDRYGNSPTAAHFSLQPLHAMHFDTQIDGKISRNHLRALGWIGFFLIATACINFINLATAQALRRSREVGVRKALGSKRHQLFWQFMTESALLTTMATAVALGFVFTLLPQINNLFGAQLRTVDFFRLGLVYFIPLLMMAMAFLSGAYPALVLSGFRPIAALNGKAGRNAGGFTLRRGLVAAQFAISQLLIIGTLAIAQQMKYTRSMDMGFRQNAVTMLPVPVREASAIGSLKARLAGIPGVESVAFCSEEPAGTETYITGIRYAGRDEKEAFEMHYKAGDADYLSTFGLQLAAGRNLTISDTSREYLINETTVRKLGLATPDAAVGQSAVINGRKGIIVGVIKDFHNRSLHQPIQPLSLTTNLSWYGRCAVSLKSADIATALPAIEKAWNAVFPDHVYQADFLDARIARMYKADQTLLSLLQTFSVLAILIGCLGLYGLISFIVANKTREVGVRKVLGASSASVLWLFGKEFLQLLLIAFLIAAPLGAWLSLKWLENFTYRIQLGPGLFFAAAGISFIILTFSAGYKALKASLANPARSLRAE